MEDQLDNEVTPVVVKDEFYNFLFKGDPYFGPMLYECTPKHLRQFNDTIMIGDLRETLKSMPIYDTNKLYLLPGDILKLMLIYINENNLKKRVNGETMIILDQHMKNTIWPQISRLSRNPESMMALKYGVALNDIYLKDLFLIRQAMILGYVDTNPIVFPANERDAIVNQSTVIYHAYESFKNCV